MALETLTLATAGISAMSKVFAERYKTAEREKKDYADKLEEATGEDIFKYLLLINTAALDAYVAQTRLQAEQSFRLSRVASVVGFLLLAVGVSLGIYSSYSGKVRITLRTYRWPRAPLWSSYGCLLLSLQPDAPAIEPLPR
jgi:Cyanobacterial TRADD-N associated 2-Transmembrane domain